MFTLFQFHIEATTDTGYGTLGDIAIDEVLVLNRTCTVSDTDKTNTGPECKTFVDTLKSGDSLNIG